MSKKLFLIMNALEFEKKLKKIDPRFYVSKNINWDYNKELGSVGIYYRGMRDGGSDIDLSYLSGEEYKVARRINEAQDLYVAYCTWKHVPEGNFFDKEKHVKAPGWREILIKLSRATSECPALLDLADAREVFGSDVGQSWYDRLDVLQKFKLQYPQIRKKKYG